MASQLERILFVPDTHAPNHDVRAWNLMMSAARGFKPNVVVSMGDLADFFAVSTWSKDPSRAFKLDEEVAVVNELLDDLDSLKAKRSIFVAGNHEDRLRRYLQDKAPELFPLLNVPDLFRLDKRGWEYVPYKANTQLGKLYLTHDIGSAGRYDVFKTLDTFQHSVVTAHTHRLAYAVEGNATGEAAVGAQFGWLGDVSTVDYMHQVKALRNWALGFGIGYLEPKTGHVYLVPVPIVKYTCVVEGTLYESPTTKRGR